MSLDEIADLHYAFQFGQDYVREGYNAQTIVEFEQKFQGQDLYQEQFNLGVEHEESKTKKLENQNV